MGRWKNILLNNYLIVYFLVKTFLINSFIILLLMSSNFILLCVYQITWISDLFGYLYVILKAYRILCYSKITFDQLPLLNPYKWPLSIFRVAANPYFKFWQNRIPQLKLGKFSYDISVILALELLSILISGSLQVRIFLFKIAESLLVENSIQFFL